MPIVGNFPKRQRYASNESRGLMTKEDVAFLHSLQDKLDSVGTIIGRKIHSFSSIAVLDEAINLNDGDIVIALGYESILDDGLIRIFKISNDPSWVGDNTVIALSFNNLYAKLILKLVDNAAVNTELASLLAKISENEEVYETDIAEIIANAGLDDCEEIAKAKIDENNIVYSSMKERIDSIAIFCDNRDIKKYGVKFTGSRSAGTRLYNAYGKSARASTDTYKGKNDFDSIYPWSHMIRCNGSYDANGNFVVTAYDGEPGFALDGSNGNVWVEIPKFYIKEVIDANGDLVMELCSAQLGEYRLPEKFINSDGITKEKVYISAYSLSEAGSVSGVIPRSGSYEIFLNEIRALGNNYCGYTADDYEIIRFLFCIEYATRNSQSVMYGATKLTQSAELAPVTDTNILIVSDTSAKFVAGQCCCIKDASGNIIVDDLTILGVTTDSDNTNIIVDGLAVTTLEGYTLWSKPWKTGSTNSVLAPSGSPVSNISGYYPCRYRYIENPWGNQWSVLYQVLCKANKIYFCKPAVSLSNKASNKYKALTYTCPEDNGYIMNLGSDDRFPSCRFPNDIEGGNSYTAYADLYIANNLDLGAVLMGGCLVSSISAGLHCMSSDRTSGDSMYYGTRLSYSK